MLYILNTRRSLRSADASAGLGNSNTNNHPSGGRSRTQWRSNAPVELSSLGGVHVRTQVETGETTSAVSLPPHKYTRLFLGMGNDLT
jgi:hypothetical protein